jgi:hypothetical protein
MAAVKQSKGQKQESKAADRETVDPALIKKLVQQLGSEDYTDREAATKRLLSIGKPVLPVLRDAAKNDADREIRRRAQRLVERLDPQVDPIEQMLKEAGKLEEQKEFEKAAALLDRLFERAKDLYSPGQAAPTTEIPFLTEVALRSAALRKRLGDYELAARAYNQASYYSNDNKKKRNEIEREWSAMVTELLTGWDGVVKKKISANESLKNITSKYPLVLLHTRRFAGGGYLQSVFSFIHETTEESKHRNNVQLQFDNGRRDNTFTLNCVVGQENTIADLGKVDFTKDPDPTKVETNRESKWVSKDCKAIDGHVYLERIKDDRGNDFYVLFQVVATDKDSRFVAFVWRKLPGGTVVKGP